MINAQKLVFQAKQLMKGKLKPETLQQLKYNIPWKYRLNSRIFEELLEKEKISIILPCFNESETISDIIHQILFLNIHNLEIIVVNDGSKDNSFEKLKKLQETEELKNILRIIHHDINKGYGRALINGILAATGDLIVTLDSDGQHNPLDIPWLCLPIKYENVDLVIGSRYEGKYHYRIPLLNRIGESFIQIILKFFFGINFINNQSGFRIFDKKVKTVVSKLKNSGMIFTTEFLIQSKLENIRMIEYPIELYNRKNGNSNVVKTRLFLELLKCVFEIKFPQKQF